MATVAELKAQADALGVKYTSKTRKADLEALIADAQRQEETQPVSRADKARQAGSKGKSATPMRNDDRAGAYAIQRGVNWLECVGNTERAKKVHTPRQARRIRKAENRAKKVAA